jgi:hypothetical protein
MTDEYSGSPSPDPVSIPDSPASPPSESSSSFGNPVEVESNPKITETRHAVLGELAKSENVESYAQERRDEEDAMFKGKDISEDRKSAWYRRASKALNDAQMEAAGIKSNGLPSQEIPEYIPRNARSDDFYPEQFDPNYQKKEGAAAERVRQYLGNNQERKQQIIEWHQAMDPECKTATWLIQNDSPIPGAIMGWTANNPEALQTIASLPARQRDIALAHLQGQLMAQESYAQQMRQQQAQWSEAAGRRVSNAPPPISRMPSGGAAPPKDLHALARNEDISSYATLRKAQERKARE